MATVRSRQINHENPAIQVCLAYHAWVVIIGNINYWLRA